MVASQYDPSTHPSLTAEQADVVKQVYKFTCEYFTNPKFDASHDINHVMRVVSNAIRILGREELNARESGSLFDLDAFTVIIAALLHDVDDKKYTDPSSNGVPVAKQELLRLGISEDEAQKIQVLIEGVSYSSEIKDPEKVQRLIRQIPELAVVQDADRLDAIGAIGIGRCFAYGGAKQVRTLDSSVDHFLDKLVKLEGMMKTETGKELAAARTRRLRDYLDWWNDETSVHAP